MRRILFPSLLCLLLAVPAAAATVEHLGQPCRGKNILSGRVISEPGSGREWLVLANTNEASNVELLFVDFENDTGRAITAPAGQGAWVLEPVPGNRMVVGTYYDGKFLVFDLEKMEFVKTVQVPGEEYVFTGALGGDGAFYGGTYPGARLARLDLDTYKVKTWQERTPGNLYLRWLNPLADGRLLCSFAMALPETKVFDPAAGTFTSATTSLSGLTRSALWNGFLIFNQDVYEGRTLEKVFPPPFPLPEDQSTTWSVMSNLTTSDTLYIRQKNTIFRARAGDKELEKVAILDSRLMDGLRGLSRSGKLVGATGQDYYVVDPETGEVKRRPIPVESGGRPPHFLEVAPDGRLWGGPWFGQTMFWHDPKTSQTVNTGVVSNRGGEVYDTAFVNGKVYAVAYVGGEVIEYDPAKPWDQWNGKNPRTIAAVGPKYIRPEGNLALGPDGRLYSGWMIRYGAYGGAVAVTDPKTGETDLYENPVGEQAISGVAADDTFIYIGTTLRGNGVGLNPEGLATFAVLARTNGKPVFVHGFSDRSITDVANVHCDVPTSTVVMTAQREVHLFDPRERRFRTAEAKLPAVTGGVVSVPGDGRAYYGSEKNLVVVELKTGLIAHQVELPGKVEKVGAGAGGPVYVSSGADVYRVTLD